MSWTCAQDFRGDLIGMIEALSANEPFALVRYGDGERAIIERRRLAVNKYLEQWDSVGADSEAFARRLEDALTETGNGWYVGVSCPCCDPPAHQWYLSKIQVPGEQITYANLVVNGNWVTWMAEAEKWWDLKETENRAVLVACDNRADYIVRPNAVNGFDAIAILDSLANSLSQEDRPIFVAAGPAAEVLIHRYWQITPPESRQPIIDVGSTFDVMLRGHDNFRRGYQMGCHSARKICHWS